MPFLNQNQLGGSLGGRIIRNKLFFYGNYEAFRQHQQSQTNYTIPTADARNGIYSYCPTGTTCTDNSMLRKVNVLSAMNATADSTMAKYLALVPTPDFINNYNVGDSTAALRKNTAGYLMNRRYNNIRDNVTAKADYLFSPRNSFTVTYAYNKQVLDRPGSDPTYSVVPMQQNNNPTKFLSAAWRFNPTPTMTNELRGGFNRAPSIFLDTQNIPDYFISGTFYSNPVAGVLRTQGRTTNTYNLQDNANWIHGSHSVSFGYQMQAVRIASFDEAGTTPIYSLGLGLNTAGLTTALMPGASSADISAANSMLASLAGYYTQASQTFNVSSPTSGYVKGMKNLRNFIQDNFAAYVQDSWRINRRLTANIGVRWDYFAPVDERDSLGLMPILEDNNVIKTILDPNATFDFAGSGVGRPWWKSSKRHFAPNLGMAFDPTGSGKWSLRAGYSISYVNDSLVRSADNNIATNTGLNTSAITATGLDGRFSAPLVTVPVPTFKVPRTMADNYAITTQGAAGMPDPGLTTPYVQQWTMGVQRSLKGTVLEVRYVGNHGTKEIRGFDYNQVMIDQLIGPFRTAANNGWLAKAATGSFNASYNPNIAGSQPLPFFDAMVNKGYLTNSTASTYLQQGQVGELATWYQINKINGPYSFFRNPYILGGNVLTNFSNSSYNGLQMEATRRFANGFQFQANYVFSKVLSDAGGDGQTNFEAFLDMNNTKLERRRAASYDIAQQFKANFYYDLPFGKGHRMNFGNGLASKIVSGWNISGIFTMQTGTPFSVYSSRGTLNRAARSSGTNTASTTLTKPELDKLFQFYKDGNGVWFFPQANRNPSDGRAVAADGAAPFTGQVFTHPTAGNLGTLQRNMFSGPSVWNLDAHAAKMTRITERTSIELRADARNVFNHNTWYVGDMTVSSTSFGKITSSFYSKRVLQFALYLRF